MPLNNEKILVTGVNSGLGKYIHESLPGSVGLNRDNKDTVLQEKKDYDLIIHSAFNSKRVIEEKDYYQYVQDNIFLTRDLCNLEHKKMVYISSIDVYSSECSDYKLSKLMAESIVRRCAENHLIFRCSSMIGPTMRNNTFMKLYREDRPVVGLTAYSTFNYVLQSDILDAIVESCDKDVQGVYDFVSSTTMSLFEVAKFFNKTPKLQFGAHTYLTPEAIDANTLNNIFPNLKKTSKQVIEKYLEVYNG